MGGDAEGSGAGAAGACRAGGLDTQAKQPLGEPAGGLGIQKAPSRGTRASWAPSVVLAGAPSEAGHWPGPCAWREGRGRTSWVLLPCRACPGVLQHLPCRLTSGPKGDGNPHRGSQLPACHLPPHPPPQPPRCQSPSQQPWQEHRGLFLTLPSAHKHSPTDTQQQHPPMPSNAPADRLCNKQSTPASLTPRHTQDTQTHNDSVSATVWQDEQSSPSTGRLTRLTHRTPRLSRPRGTPLRSDASR